jgi:hypothetical protein
MRALDLVPSTKSSVKAALKRELSDAIMAFEAPRPDDAPRRKRPQNADAPGDKPSSLGW